MKGITIGVEEGVTIIARPHAAWRLRSRTMPMSAQSTFGTPHRGPPFRLSSVPAVRRRGGDQCGAAVSGWRIGADQ